MYLCFAAITQTTGTIFTGFALHGGIGLSYNSFTTDDGFVYQLKANVRSVDEES